MDGGVSACSFNTTQRSGLVSLIENVLHIDHDNYHAKQLELYHPDRITYIASRLFLIYCWKLGLFLVYLEVASTLLVGGFTMYQVS